MRSQALSFARTPSFADFFDELGEVEHGRLTRLWACAGGLSRSDPGVREEAEMLVRAMPDEDDGHGAGTLRTFAEALLARLQTVRPSGGNLYLEARPPGAQLRAFELLRLRTPLIAFAYAAGNRALMDAIGEPTDVTLVDVGIGRAGQIAALLKHPNTRRVIKSLHVVGVEPDSSADTGMGALQIAERNVLEAAHRAGIPTTFAGVPRRGEQLTADDLRGANLRGKIIANASFCLHHVGADPLQERVAVLRVLREVGAEAVVLVEPDSDHCVEDLETRFLYAYRHYRTVAKSLDAMLSASDAALVWGEFFAPEVRNIIGCDAGARTERHEDSTRWLEHVRAAGWTPDELPDLVPQAAAPPGFTTSRQGPVFSLAFDEVELLSVVRATHK